MVPPFVGVEPESAEEAPAEEAPVEAEGPAEGQ